jgi:hypothetical protein
LKEVAAVLLLLLPNLQRKELELKEQKLLFLTDFNGTAVLAFHHWRPSTGPSLP